MALARRFRSLNVISALRKSFSTNGTRKEPIPCKLCLEPLEDRRLLTVFAPPAATYQVPAPLALISGEVAASVALPQGDVPKTSIDSSADITTATSSGTWTQVTDAPSSIGTMMLLPNGRVMAQRAGTTSNWYQLAPNSTGSYVNGTWSPLASMGLERLYFGSNVLSSGKVFVVGGEYSGPAGTNNWTNTGEIYDPVGDSWTSIAPFPQSQFGDDPTTMLPDGRVLTGYLGGPQTYIYNPTNNTWSTAGTKLRGDRSDEESWVLLPDGSILSYDVFSSISTGIGHAQRYVPATNTWVDTGVVPVALSSSALGFELGPAFLLPDGRVFQVGANSNTALYNPSSDTWAAGPTIPNAQGADDAPGAELPNGHVIFAADTPLFHGPTQLFDFDPTTNTISQFTSLPPQLALDLGGPSFVSRMLVLPTGQIMLTMGNSTRTWIFSPTDAPIASSRPTISSIVPNPDGTYTLTGTQLNGVSEGASYGDDAEMSSNYPIVRLTDTTGHVFYARTFNWSNTGVATGSTPVTTQFALPVGLPNGTYTLEVIANGISSSPATLAVGVLAVVSSTPANGAVVSSTPASYVIGFSAPIDPATLQASDLKVNSVGANSVMLSADNKTATFTYTVDPVTSQGLQTMTMAAGAVTLLDPPANGLQAFSSTFRYDALLLQVTSTNPPNGGVFTLPGPFTYDVTFNEPINPASVTTNSLVLSGISGATVAGVNVLAGNTTARFTLNGITSEGTLNASIAAGAVTDQYGNLGAAFTAAYNIDIGTFPFPVPLSAKAPLGSLIYDPAATGFITPIGDTDTFTLSVDPGQTISVLVTPTSAGLRPTVQLLSPTNAVIGTDTATAAGLMALIQATPTTGTVTGTYKIIIAGASGTTGSYSVQVTLNAALELEGSLAWFSDDTPATAQGISGSLIGLSASDPSVQRAAVLGKTDVSTGYGASAASFAFENISTTGTAISFSDLDDGATTIPIGFNFSMFSTIYTNLYVSTNGFITFGSAYTSSPYVNTDLTSSPSQAAIAPFWDDLYDTGAADSKIVYQLLGSGSTTHLVIQWNNVSYYDDSTRSGGLTFEAVLNIDGSVRFNYQSLATSHNGGTHDLGISATTGIKDAGTQGSNRLLSMYNNGPTALVNSGKSVVIAPLAPTPDLYSVTVAAGETDTLALTGLSSGSLNLELVDGGGSLIATGIAGATNLTRVISNFNFITPGTYYARVTGDQNVSYSLIATRNTAFDTESNGTFATAQSLDGTRGALGYVKGGFSTMTDFESGQAGYVINNNIRGTGSSAGLWHLSTLRGAQTGHSPSNSFYYGGENTGTYNTGAANAGSITSPVIALPASGPVNLSFNYVLQTEGSTSFDTANVQVSTDGFATATTVGSRGSNLPNSATWTSFTASLAAFIGQNIQIRFVFDTTDAISNNFEGWYVDDVQLVSTGFDQDWYSITTTGTANQLTLATSTPAGGSGEFVNTLPPKIELYNPSGTLVASGVIGPDGRNQSIQYFAAVPGVYRVRVLSQNSNLAGEYFLSSLLGSSAVTNRQLFYANSAYDGYTGNPATSHDEAISPDKVALLPNQGESTFANISSYTAGINGIMVDLSAGANHAAMKANAAADFTFKVSGPFASNTPSTWTTLNGANQPSVNVRLGDPAAGTDRIELTWPDGTILGTWLEVIVKANADSGLAADDVFFFGSSPGDTGLGNDPDASFVDATDEISARNHQESDLSLSHTYSVAVSNIYDVNKDDQVDATDQILARNFGNTYGELDYISIAGSGPFAPATGGAGAAVASDLFNSTFDVSLSARFGAVPAAAIPSSEKGPTAAVVSALAGAMNRSSSIGNVSTWLPDGLQDIALNGGEFADYAGALSKADSPHDKMILAEADRMSDDLWLDDELLDSLIVAKLE